MDKYYYGIKLRNGDTYCIESEIDNAKDYIHRFINGKWYEFKCITPGVYDQAFNRVVVRVDDIVSIAFMLPEKDKQ